MIRGVFHSSYTVSDVERSVQFCGHGLGIEHTKWQVSDQPYLAAVTGIPGVSLRIGFARAEGDDSLFEMVEYVHPKGGRANTGFGVPGSIHVAWAVDSLYAAVKRLEASGVQVLAAAHPVADGAWPSAQGVFLLDPDGLLVELIEPKVGPDGTGRLLRLHHTSFTVTSLDHTIEVLCDKLGLTLQATSVCDSSYLRHFSSMRDNRVKMAYLAIPGAEHRIELWQFVAPSGNRTDTSPTKVGNGHLCLLVDGIWDEYRALRAKGIPFAGEPTEITAGANKGGYSIYFRAGEDIRMELFQRPLPSASLGIDSSQPRGKERRNEHLQGTHGTYHQAAPG